MQQFRRSRAVSAVARRVDAGVGATAAHRLREPVPLLELTGPYGGQQSFDGALFVGSVPSSCTIFKEVLTVDEERGDVADVGVGRVEMSLRRARAVLNQPHLPIQSARVSAMLQPKEPRSSCEGLPAETVRSLIRFGDSSNSFRRRSFSSRSRSSPCSRQAGVSRVGSSRRNLSSPPDAIDESVQDRCKVHIRNRNYLSDRVTVTCRFCLGIWTLSRCGSAIFSVTSTWLDPELKWDYYCLLITVDGPFTGTNAMLQHCSGMRMRSAEQLRRKAGEPCSTRSGCLQSFLLRCCH